MLDPTWQLLSEGAIAAGIGLFIGLEREHHETVSGPAHDALRRRARAPGGDSAGAGAGPGTAAGNAAGDADDPALAAPADPPLGVRTFALLSLCGWTASLLAEAWSSAPALALAVVGGLLTAQFVRTTRSGRNLGLTTEVGALLTFLLGMLVHAHARLAVILALAVTLILISRPWVRSVVPRLLRTELVGTLQFLIVLAVVLPLLPVEAPDPWGVLPPRRIGLFVVLVSGISFTGYVLARLLGRSASAGLTGLIGGLVSSTAVTLAMAQQAASQRAMVRPGQLAVLLANAVMVLRVLVVTAVISRDVALALAVPLGAMEVILLGAAFVTWRGTRASAPGPLTPGGATPGDARAAHVARTTHAAQTAGGPADEAAAPLAVSNPFALVPALKCGLLLCVVLVVARLARTALGDAGLLAAAAASGLADVDPITLATAREAADGLLPTSTAVLAISLAVLANTAVKAGIARLVGGAPFGTRVALVLGTATAAGVGAALLS